MEKYILCSKEELIELTADSITKDPNYKNNIIRELEGYNNEKLINAVCEYTDLVKKDFIYLFSGKI